MGLSQDNFARARQLIALYPHKRSALIPVLHLLQEQEGYLSPDGIEDVAALLELTPAEVRGTASFYDMFHLEPVGRYLVAVCTNIACMLRGGEEILDHCKKKLGISHKGTTQDGLFSLEEVECIGACSWAPAAQVNYDFHENLTNTKMDEILDEYKKKGTQ